MSIFISSELHVNAKDKDGDTPLRTAADNDYTDIVNILKAHGAKK